MLLWMTFACTAPPPDTAEDSDTNGDSDTDVGCVLDADATVTSTADLSALQDVCEITGNLDVQSSSLSEISLPDLTRIGKGLNIASNPQLTTVSLPALEEIGWTFQVHTNGRLATLELPVLARILGEDPSIAGSGITAVALTELELPELATMAGEDNLQIALCPVLATIDIPKLTYARNLGIDQNPLLTRVSMGAFAGNAESVTFFDDPKLETLELPGLVHQEGLLQISGSGLVSLSGLSALQRVLNLAVTENPALTSMDGLEQLTTIDGVLQVTGNSSLVSLTGMGNVTSVAGDVTVTNNGALTQCEIDAFLTGVTVGGTTQASGAECP